MRIFIEYAPAGGNEAAGKISGHVRTKVTVYFRTIRSGFNNKDILPITNKGYNIAMELHQRMCEKYEKACQNYGRLKGL